MRHSRRKLTGDRKGLPGPRLLRLQWRRNWRRLAHDPAKFECQNSGEKEHGQKHGGELPK